MNVRLDLFVLLAVGCLLIAGTTRAIFFGVAQAPAKKPAIVLETPIDATAPAPEPIFPGLPAR